jgi:site-specific DNA recombinase
LRGKKRIAGSLPRRITYGYVRVSTEDQAREGVSLEAQIERIRAFAVATGRELAEIVSDAGLSAKSLERPGLAKVLAGVETREVGAVIVLKLDRLTRSVRDLADLLEMFEEAGTALVSCQESLDTGTASGRLMLHLLASVSQWEREAISERTAFALGHKRRSGKAYGRVPFGFRRQGDDLIEIPEAQVAITKMRHMHEAGASLRQIAAMLTQSGLTPPQGGKAWHAASVRAVLQSRIIRDRTIQKSDYIVRRFNPGT